MTPIQPYLAREGRLLLFGLTGQQTSLKGVWILAALFFVPLAVAAVLTPPAHHLVEYLHKGPQTPILHYLHRKSVPWIFDYLRLGAMVLGLWWAIRAIVPKGTLRLGFDWAALRSWAPAYVSGLAIVMVLAGLQLSFATVTATGAGLTLLALAKTFASSFMVGFVEEILFRGIVLQIFYAATRRPWLALIATSAAFAYVHFKLQKIALLAPGEAVDWLTGWKAAGWTVFGVAVNFNAGEFVTLFLLGLLLGAVRLKCATLWPVIGLHSGLVMAVLTYTHLYRVKPQDLEALWGRTSLADGWITSLVLLVALIAVAAWPHGQRGHRREF